jgi:hypothetical protein
VSKNVQLPTRQLIKVGVLVESTIQTARGEQLMSVTISFSVVFEEQKVADLVSIFLHLE